MKKVSVKAAQRNLDELIDEALKGEEIIISHRGRLFVRLEPVESNARKESHR